MTDLHKRVYGWVKDAPDPRDFQFRVSEPVALPPSVDLRPKMPAVYDQGQLGSCTANAIGGALEFEEIAQNEQPVMPSRLFIYYNERAAEGTVNEDAGAAIRDGIKVVHQFGAADESLWPYRIASFTEQPPAEIYAQAKKHAALAYHAVAQDKLDLMTALALGKPVVFGFTVYSNFESPAMAQSPWLAEPEGQVLGGHAVLCVGYDTTHEPGKTWFLVRNSWGEGWGEGGYFWMSEDYITNPNLASDFWVIDTEGVLA